MTDFTPQAPINERAPLYDDRPEHEIEIERLDAMIGTRDDEIEALRARVAELEGAFDALASGVERVCDRAALKPVTKANNEDDDPCAGWSKGTGT